MLLVGNTQRTFIQRPSSHVVKRQWIFDRKSENWNLYIGLGIPIGRALPSFQHTTIKTIWEVKFESRPNENRSLSWTSWANNDLFGFSISYTRSNNSNNVVIWREYFGKGEGKRNKRVLRLCRGTACRCSSKCSSQFSVNVNYSNVLWVDGRLASIGWLRKVCPEILHNLHSIKMTFVQSKWIISSKCTYIVQTMVNY